MNITSIPGLSSGIDASQMMNKMGRMRDPDPSVFAAKMMEHKDANGDGVLSLEEVSSGERSMPEEVFTRIDADGDGLLTQEEIAAGRPERPPVFGSASEASGALAALLESLTQAEGESVYNMLAQLFQGDSETSEAIDISA